LDIFVLLQAASYDHYHLFRMILLS